MSDISNGETRRPYATRPPQMISYALTTSRAASAGTTVVHRTPINAIQADEDERLSNFKRQRYWNSWEELFIIEQWRHHKTDINDASKSVQIYRNLSSNMRNKGMAVSTQDCRRKINNLTNRYKIELRNLKSKGMKSEWRLFPLVHLIHQPRPKNLDTQREQRTVRKLLERLPKPIAARPTLGSLTNHMNPNAQNPIANPNTARSLTSASPSSTSTCIASLLNSTSELNANLTNSACPDNQSPMVSKTTTNASKKIFLSGKNMLPFININWLKLEQIRQENKLLATQKDENLKRLRLEEQHLKNFKIVTKNWYSKQEKILQSVDGLKMKQKMALQQNQQEIFSELQ